VNRILAFSKTSLLGRKCITAQSFRVIINKTKKIKKDVEPLKENTTRKAKILETD